MSIRKVRQFWRNFALGLVLVFGIASCDIAAFKPSQPLASVEPLPLPPLPEWIEQISPTEQADPLAQIRIRFKDPLIPVESLDSPDQQAQLSQFEVMPPIAGRFRFLTPRMVGFQSDQALPKATRFRVTLKAGLADLNNHTLDQDFAWTFNTEAIALTNLPGVTAESGDEVEPFDLKPILQVTSNVELDVNSVQEHVRLLPHGQNQSVPLKVEVLEDANESEPAESYNQSQETFDPSQRLWLYTLTPQRELEKATTYRLEVAPGLRPTQGNLVSETPFISQLQTYAPLAFEGLQYVGQPDAGGAYGRFVKGSAQLRFNNGLEAASALDTIRIEPAPKESPRSLQSYDGEALVNLNPWALEPATNYTITVGADLKDKFGQTLGQPVTVQYDTGDVAAELWAPSNLHIFPNTKDLQLNISAVNLPEGQYKAAYRVMQPTDLVYSDSAYPQGQGNDLLPPIQSWRSLPVQGTKNQSTEIAVPLREQLGGSTGMLAYGVQARANPYQQDHQTLWREPTYYGLVQLTNLGVFAQWFPESGFVRVHHLADGSPVAGAAVEVYESKLDATTRPQPTPCATGTTDQTGALLLDLAAMQRCIPNSGRGFTDAPNLLAIAREGQDWAFVRTLEWSGGYDYDINAGWAGNRPETRGAIVSDRQLYQPGERAWFTGFVYYLQNGALQQGKNTQYEVRLRAPDGTETSLGTQTTNEFGTFSLEVPLTATQPLGFYTLFAKGSNDLEISGEFRVAEFKPPNFQVDLTLDKEFTFVGEQVKADAQSNYLFGAPVQEGRAEYYVTRERAEFVPPGWEQYTFGRQWFWPEEEPSIAADVLQTSALLDEQGKGSETVTIEDDLPYPMTYQVDVQVSDVSNLAVADSQSFVALPSDRLIGLQSDFVAQAGQPFDVTVAVVNPQGETQANQAVRVELQQMIYSSVTQVIEGSRTARDQVEYKTVAQVETRSGKTPDPVSLTATEGGSYRIRANFTNARNEATATDVQLWVTGENEVNWGDRYTNERIEIQLDKETYKPGEIANVLIQSPYPEAELYFAVVQHDTLYKTVTKVKGGAPQIQFQVTPEMLPNAAVEVVLVRQGVPLQQVEPGALEDLVRIGFAPFKLNLDEQYLTVTATPQAESTLPNASQTVQLTVQRQGQPVPGQVTVMVVNEAVLQLTGYRPPNLVETVYAEQPISTRFADNRPDVVLQPLTSPIDKGWGFGGGYSSGAGNTRIRTNFQPLAYYNGSVRTDANGQATVTFTLPDNLTTWRVMAIATDGQLHFGNAETTFITTKPLITNAILPQFARPGDRLSAGLSVTNTTNQEGTLAIAGVAEGSLQADNTSLSQQAQAQSGTTAYRFPIVATGAGEGKVQFSTQLGTKSDAFVESLAVKPLDVTEQVVESGTTTTGVQIPLKVDEQVMNDIGGLELSLASTLVADLQVPARQVFQDEPLPFLEPAASQLAIAANLQFLNLTYGSTDPSFVPVGRANQALQQLKALQQADGGFASYPGAERSDLLVTPYAAQAIATATALFQGVTTPATLQVNGGMVNLLKGYLQRTLADPGQYDFCQEQTCKDPVRLEMLLALKELGETRTDFLAELYDRRAQFDLVTQIKLAQYLSQLPDWNAEATALTAQLQESIAETGRTATVNLPQTWRWLNSPIVPQAEALRLFVARQSDPAVVDRLVQGLLSQRRNGTWGSTYDTAAALIALVDYSQLQSPPPNFTATAQLAGKTLTSAQFQGYDNASETVTVPMADLPRGDNNLTLQKTGEGTLHYLAAYRYRLQDNPPGRFNGLRVTRSIRAANQPDVLKQYGLFDDDKPLTVRAGQVLDVGLEVITDRPVDHVLMTDPLPAGFEAVDASFQTATPYFQARGDRWQIGYQTTYRDRIVAYGDRLEPGVYTLHYLVRAVTPGTFSYPGAEAHLQYAAEEFGRSTASTLEVSE